MAVFLFSSIKVPRSTYLILAVVLQYSYGHNLVKGGIDPLLGLSAFTSTILLPMAFEKKILSPPAWIKF